MASYPPPLRDGAASATERRAAKDASPLGATSPVQAGMRDTPFPRPRTVICSVRTAYPVRNAASACHRTAHGRSDGECLLDSVGVERELARRYFTVRNTLVGWRGLHRPRTLGTGAVDRCRRANRLAQLGGQRAASCDAPSWQTSELVSAPPRATEVVLRTHLSRSQRTYPFNTIKDRHAQG